MGTDMGENAWLQEIMAETGGLEFGPDEIAAISAWLMKQETENRVNQAQYQKGFLEYLSRQQDIDTQKLAQAERELAFQSGEYWDYFTGEYMDLLHTQTANEKSISDNAVLQSQYGADAARFGADQAREYAYGARQQALAGQAAADREKYAFYRDENRNDLAHNRQMNLMQLNRRRAYSYGY